MSNFTDFNKMMFDSEKYYREIFIKNTDIWGFITIYYSILYNIIHEYKFKSRCFCRRIIG